MRRRMPLATLVALAALVISQLAAGHAPAGAQETPSTPPVPKPRATIVVDAASGRVLVGDHIHDAFPPASTAKIMTALVAAERLRPNATITVNAYAAAAPEQEIGFLPGTKMTLDQMLASLMMMSANDAAYALAYTTSGSLDGFAKTMNATARRLGLKNSTFNDPSGLDTDQSFEGGPRASVYDLAIVTRNALTVPAIAKWAATHETDFTSPSGAQYHFVNHNRMLPGGLYAYAGATGFKTGFTNRAQHSIVATATRNDRTLIAVVLGAVTPGGYAEASAALDAGFAVSDGTLPVPPELEREALPDNKVSLYAGRAADRKDFSKLGRPPASDTGGAGAVLPTVVPEVIPALASPPPAPPKETTVTAPRSSSQGFVSTRNAVILVVLLLFVAVMLRRRAVRRQRARREARRRQRAAAMRSGGLPVVDGRYRPGLRIGPPVESHVRVRRNGEHTGAEHSRLG